MLSNDSIIEKVLIFKLEISQKIKTNQYFTLTVINNKV